MLSRQYGDYLLRFFNDMKIVTIRTEINNKMVKIEDKNFNQFISDMKQACINDNLDGTVDYWQKQVVAWYFDMEQMRQSVHQRRIHA